MSLTKYRKKRDFKITAEPKGVKSRSKNNSFVIQKHAATRLHYDLRLEMEGVLKSWAVPKGPSLSPTDRRLAIHVEDHPREYGSFEGVIPKGQYGAGEVIVWDRGTWSPVGDPIKSYKKGKLEFDLKGKKLKGRWALVKMAENPDYGKGGDNWLLIKKKDEYVSDKNIVELKPKSVLSGKKVEDLKAKVTKAPKRSIKRASKK